MTVSANPDLFPTADQSLDGHTDAVYNMTLTNSYLITCSRDTTLRIWSLETRKLVHPPLQGHTKSVLAVAACVSSGFFVSAGVDGRLIAWNLETFECRRMVDNAHTDSILSIAASASLVVTEGKDKLVKMWESKRLCEMADSNDPLAPIFTLSGHIAAVNSVAMTDKVIISGAGDRGIRVWDIATKACIRTINVHSMGITRLEICPLHRYIVSSSSDNTIRISDIDTGEELQCLRGHTELVRSVCVVRKTGSTDFDTIVSGSYDGSVWVWSRRRMDAKKDSWVVTKQYKMSDVLPPLENNVKNRVFQVLSDGTRLFCTNASSSIIAWQI
ncbi:WD40 repeat-like protein [Pseudovirgaria hyperparasitica]|uniref:Mitochondrial division protein 1 n=1 Tax=Pseudovirgaria hyperparasitica TaxID=470096 RepID=A0A6A6W6M1_9PEZI|nr:WD40 repeat-like protein [Pseudovirgaria hyperparasitica]KAF2757610.1 WD40 repeat-like protein [Pseudovirgaria hyperparasitica]